MTRFVVVGGGPAGTSAASQAAKLGAEVTLVEREIVGGAAHLWDCIPSKAMIATGASLSAVLRARRLGLDLGNVGPLVNPIELAARVSAITTKLSDARLGLLRSQGVRLLSGTGRFVSPNSLAVDLGDGHSEDIEFDAALISTGSRPRLPAWAPFDGERILSTRESYPPPEMPSRLVVIGSGVTGVEFTHMFSALGAEVSLLVSRQQVLPGRDPEVAAALEDEFLRRKVDLLKGARACGVARGDDAGRDAGSAGGARGSVRVDCEDGRVVRGSHAIFCIGSIPNSDGLGLDEAGVAVNESGHVPINAYCQTNIPNIYAGGDVAGTLPLSSVAHAQGRKIADHALGRPIRRVMDYDKAASAIFTQPEIADVGLAEAEAFAEGRKVRSTKVPFSSNARALLVGDARGFVKIVSDPATGIVLGGSVVGRQASELIAVIALAVNAHLRVEDLVETIMVHPALSESLADAAE